MRIDKEKCSAWIDLILALIRMTSELNKYEVKYIKATLAIKYGNLQMQKLNEED